MTCHETHFLNRKEDNEMIILTGDVCTIHRGKSFASLIIEQITNYTNFEHIVEIFK